MKNSLLSILGLGSLLAAAPLGASCTREPDPAEGPPMAVECRPGPVSARSASWQADATFPVGPALMHSDPWNATLMWETDAPCDGLVRFGSSVDRLDQVVPSERDQLIHVARLTGLSPDSRYTYRVEACGTETSLLSFYTAPLPGTPVRFAVVGDNRSFPDAARAVAEAMTRSAPHFVVHTGDLVSGGHDYLAWKEQLFDPTRGLGHFVSTFAALGNHEQNAEAFYRYTAYPYDPQVADHGAFGSNYAFTYGNVFFLVVDTNNLGFHLAVLGETELSSWIDKQLRSEAARAAVWRVAVGHHPAFTESWTPGECDGYSGTAAVAEWFFPLLAQAGFQLYLAGHTHAYERGEWLGVTQLISGGGGAALDEICRDLEQTTVVKDAYHYLDIEAGCEALTVRVMEVPGPMRPFDELVIRRR